MINLKTKSIKVQMLLFIIIIVIDFIGVVLIYYKDISNTTIERINKINQEVVAQTVLNINGYCQNLIRISNNVAYSKMVQKFLVEKDNSEKNKLYSNINDLILNIIQINPEITSIKLFNMDNEYIQELEKLQSSKSIYNKIWFSSTIDKTSSIKIETGGLFLISDVYASEGSNLKKMIGKVMIVFHTSAFGLNITEKDENKSMQMLLVDRNNQIISYNTDKSLQIWKYIKSEYPTITDDFTIQYDGDRYSIGKVNVKQMDGMVIYITSPVNVFTEINNQKVKVVIVFGSALFILLIAFVMINRNMILPVRKFIGFMQELSKGNIKYLGKKINIQGYAEINEMAEEFNRMMLEIKNLSSRLIHTSTRLYEMELAKKQAQISYLQSQINPHFLYNTLESFKGLALRNNNMEIWQMAKSLGSIFKYGIRTDDFVLLSEEVFITKEYVIIQEIRFKGRLEVIFNFSEDSLQCRVPRMIIQPFIENAIFHGMEPSEKDKCTILLQGFIHKPEVLNIGISDDGAGMDEETLETLKSKLVKSIEGSLDKGEQHGIGITNVNNRLKLIYDEKYSMQISSQNGVGTEILLSLPLWRDTDV